MADGTRPFPATRLIVIAAAAGILAGAVAVYVRGGAEGNIAAEPVAAADQACAAKAERAKAIAAAATGEVAAMGPADPPLSLASLSFGGPDGSPVTIADFAGKTLLVNLWATWCAPCRAEMPALDRLQAASGSDRFEVVAVSVDKGDDAKPRAFLAEVGVAKLRFFHDGSMALFNEMQRRALVLGLPVTLLIDPQGCLLASMNGPAEWSSADAARLVDAATRP